MAEKNKDDLADALKRLARGDERDDSQDAVPSESAPLDIPAPAQKRAPAPGMLRPQVVKKVAPKPAVPTSGKSRPAVSSRPEMMSTPSALPTSAPGDPPPDAAPGKLPGADVKPRADAPQDEISSSLANVIDDSDLSVSFTAGAVGPRIARRSGPSRSLTTRRTMIPILLTLGVCLPLVAGWWFHLPDDAPVRGLGSAFPFAMLIGGGAMLLLAVINMLSVRHDLAEAVAVEGPEALENPLNSRLSQP
jgi:hypothetical protein